MIVSYVKPVLHLLKTSVLAEKEDDTNLTKTIKVKILDYMNTKYDDPETQELLDIASFMDPRFKVSNSSSKKVPRHQDQGDVRNKGNSTDGN